MVIKQAGVMEGKVAITVDKELVKSQSVEHEIIKEIMSPSMRH